MCHPLCLNKVRKTAKIRKRYDQVPHLTQDTTSASNKNTIKIVSEYDQEIPQSQTGQVTKIQ